MNRCAWLMLFTAAVLFAQDDLPPGKGKQEFQRICTACHELEQVTVYRNSKTSWANLVDDMVSRGAQGTDDEIKLVVSYLSSYFGKPVNVNLATAKEIQSDLSFTDAESQAVVQYRTDHGKFASFADLAKVPGLRAEVLDEQKKNILF